MPTGSKNKKVRKSTSSTKGPHIIAVGASGFLDFITIKPGQNRCDAIADYRASLR